MNKKKLIVIIAAIATLCLALVACAAIDGIRFEKEPRTTYVQGQDIDLQETVLVAFTGEKTKPVDLSKVEISGYDKNTLGEQTVSFTYEDKTITLKINVIPRMQVEGATANYFVGDQFNKQEGRIKVADDQGKITTVEMDNEAVTVVEFDSSTAAKNKTVTIQYGSYTGTFTVNVYEVETVEMTSRPKKTTYLSHEQQIDLTGAYFTVTAKNNEHQGYVTWTQDMISGYDPTVATPENMEEPAKQTLTVTYLGQSFQFDVSIRYSGVTLMMLRANELRDVTDPKTVTVTQGQKALDAMDAYFDLTNAQAALIPEADVKLISMIATVYGYGRFKEEADSLSGTITLYSQQLEDDLQTDKDESTTEGAFAIVAESYDTVVRDLKRLVDKNDPFVILCQLLANIEDEFPEMEIDGVMVDDYLDLIYSVDTLDQIVDVLEMMVELHEAFAEIPDDWTAEDLVNYKGDIKSVVVTITNSEYNPFTTHISYVNFFEVVSYWRTNNDYMEIIYTYYMEHEPDILIDALWQKVPLPGDLQGLYNNIRYGGKRAVDMAVGTDTTLFMYYFMKARQLQAQIKERNDEFEMKLYELINFDYLIDTTFFFGLDDEINGVAYLYHVSSLIGNEKYDVLLQHYLSILDMKTAGSSIDFTSAEVQQSCERLLELYLELSPAEKFAFLGSLYCDYRYSKLDRPMLAYMTGENGIMVTYSWFASFIYNAYNSTLSEEGFHLLADLMVASEYHTIRYQNPLAYQSFLNLMAEITQKYSTIPAADQEKLEKFYNLYNDIYNECLNPSEFQVSDENMARFTELEKQVNNYFEFVNYLKGEIPQSEKAVIIALTFADYERIRSIVSQIVASGEAAAIDLMNNKLISFDTDREGNADLICTFDYVVDMIGDTHYDAILTADVTVEDDLGESTTYFAYSFYNNDNYKQFLEMAYDFMLAAFRGEATTLSYADALELMAKYNTFADRQRFTNMILSSNTLYFTALATCFEQHIENEEVKNVVRALLDVQRFHEIYLVKQGDVSQATFMQGVELMKTMYESLSDQGLFADFQAYYDYYLAVYEQIQAED